MPLNVCVLWLWNLLLSACSQRGFLFFLKSSNNWPPPLHGPGRQVVWCQPCLLMGRRDPGGACGALTEEHLRYCSLLRGRSLGVATRRTRAYGLRVHLGLPDKLCKLQVPSPCLSRFPHLHRRTVIYALPSSHASLHPKPQQGYYMDSSRGRLQNVQSRQCWPLSRSDATLWMKRHLVAKKNVDSNRGRKWLLLNVTRIQVRKTYPTFLALDNCSLT